MSDNKFLLIGILLIIAFIVLLFGGAFWASSIACTQKWKDFEPRYGFWTGCQVKIDGRWMPASALREITP